MRLALTSILTSLVEAHKETEHYKTWAATVAAMMARPRVSRKYITLFPSPLYWHKYESLESYLLVLNTVLLSHFPRSVSQPNSEETRKGYFIFNRKRMNIYVCLSSEFRSK